MEPAGHEKKLKFFGQKEANTNTDGSVPAGREVDKVHQA